MLRTFKYRLYPRPTQEAALTALLGDFCSLYNAALESRIDAHRKGVKLTYGAQAAELKVLRVECPEFARWSHTAKQHVLRRLDKAFRAFFSRLKAGKKAGFPRFQARARWDTAEFTFGDGLRLHGNRLRIVGIPGGVKIWWHRSIPDQGKIKHAKITRNSGRWFVCFSVETTDAEPAPIINLLGIDVGLDSFIACSDGETVKAPRFFREGQQRLRVLQRAVARKRKGSTRRRKAVAALAHFHRKLTARRTDFLHHQANAVLSKAQHIAVEDLNIKGLAKTRLAKSIHDAAWRRFLDILSYKAANAGGWVEKVDPRYTSQACSGCGSLVPKGLSIRQHDCPECGLRLDRDVNAARNILYRSGLDRWAQSTRDTARLVQEAVCFS